MKQNVTGLNKRRGDEVTATEVNATILSAYLKFNALIPDNVKIMTTGQFLGDSSIENLNIPNYSGTMDGINTSNEITPVATETYTMLYDAPIRREIINIDQLLKKLEV